MTGRDRWPGDSFTGGVPDPDLVAALSGLLHNYGEQWQIQRQASPDVWVAVRRPEPGVMEIHCAHSVAELRAKLVAADGE
jgi:hypothetical protein